MLDATPTQLEFMDGELSRFLSSGAWEPGHSHRWVSRLFLVPKPGHNKWRLIIDLRPLNEYCVSRDLKFETLGRLGQLFVGMLKAVAPLLVMVLVMSAVANRHESGQDGRKTFMVIALYFTGTVSRLTRAPASAIRRVWRPVPQPTSSTRAPATSPSSELTIGCSSSIKALS